MQKTGKIINIVTAGSYQSQRNETIHTFEMTIQCLDGTFTGEIGSKTQIYPKQIGEEICVEVTNTEHGVRFKKINPQYAGGGSQGGGGQKADPNRELHIKREVAIKAVMSATTIPSDLIADYLLASMVWIESGTWNLMPPTHGTLNNIPPDSFPDDDPSF